MLCDSGSLSQIGQSSLLRVRCSIAPRPLKSGSVKKVRGRLTSASAQRREEGVLGPMAKGKGCGRRAGEAVDSGQGLAAAGASWGGAMRARGKSLLPPPARDWCEQSGFGTPHGRQASAVVVAGRDHLRRDPWLEAKPESPVRHAIQFEPTSGPRVSTLEVEFAGGSDCANRIGRGPCRDPAGDRSTSPGAGLAVAGSAAWRLP